MWQFSATFEKKQAMCTSIIIYGSICRSSCDTVNSVVVKPDTMILVDIDSGGTPLSGLIDELLVDLKQTVYAGMYV